MGILNTTPDSFSDGGKFFSVESALKQTELMLAQGAHIIDVGGESTRPGAKAVSADEELGRVIPVIEAICKRFDCEISIDTSKAEVMREAVAAGATVINDVYGLRREGALQAAASLNVPVCIMHMQGEPRTMQANPQYKQVVNDVGDFLQQRLDAFVEAGGNGENLWLDPGFGFGKTLEHNLALVNELDTLVQRFRLPVLVGVSRKSMIDKISPASADQRIPGSLALAVLMLQKGASIFRVHDVAETKQALAVAQAVMDLESS